MKNFTVNEFTIYELWFRKQLSQDTKALSKINFDDLPSEDDWNSLQP